MGGGWILIIIVIICLIIYFAIQNVNRKDEENRKRAKNNPCWNAIKEYNSKYDEKKLSNENIDIAYDSIRLDDLNTAICDWKTRYSIIISKNTNWQGYKKYSNKDNVDNYLIGMLYKNYESMVDLVRVCQYNQEHFSNYGITVFNHYLNKCRNAELATLEDEIFLSIILKPMLYPKVVVRFNIASYQGHGITTYDEEEVHYTYKEWIALLLKAKEKIGRKSFIEDERRKMSDSLRYRVLERDGFCCQICGSKRIDGIKLEVDHIVPISKGGRTELNNLQTLCERCNRGKSNRIYHLTNNNVQQTKSYPKTTSNIVQSESETVKRICMGNCSTCNRDTCIEEMN